MVAAMRTMHSSLAGVAAMWSFGSAGRGLDLKIRESLILKRKFGKLINARK